MHQKATPATTLIAHTSTQTRGDRLPGVSNKKKKPPLKYMLLFILITEAFV